MNKYIDTVCVSGYFIWLHEGHIQYLKEASELGRVIVILNNDYQQVLKYKKVIVPLNKRMRVVSSIKYVDEVVESMDYDRTVCRTLIKIRPDIFFNGGDRTGKNIPELETCEQLGIQTAFGSGEKLLSSSDLLSRL